MTNRARLALGVVALATGLFASRPAAAQLGLPGAPGPKPTQAGPQQPQTHAASGAGDDAIPKVTGAEPSLPADPLAVPPEVASKIGTDSSHEVETGKGPFTVRRWYGPYYSETSGQYSFKTVFPVWAERNMPNDRASLYGMLYYNRRSTKYDADILFPFFWNVRDDQSRTTVVGPFAHREAPGEHDNWLAPLVFSGSRPNGGYFHIPPLLTFTRHDDKGGFNLVGPAFCSWKGGSTCNLKEADDIDFGIAPLFFAGKSERSRYEFAPPLLHYFKYSELEDSSLNVWGPFVWKHTKETDAFDVVPFFWHLWGKNEDHVTVLPFFHYGYKGNATLFVNPLYLAAHDEDGADTFVTWGYARYRGRTKLDMITPFYWHYEDPDIGLDRKILFPFLYASRSPRGEGTAFFPFWAHFKKPNITETTWVTPFFQHTHDLTGWSTNIHPLVYLGRSYDESHTVVAPFFWDFASPDSRATVAFPVYWRFSDRNSVSQLLLNTYYHERKLGGGRLDWEFHFFPAFSYGETPDGHWWNVLYGLAGYTRRGPSATVRALWIPIDVGR